MKNETTTRETVVVEGRVVPKELTTTNTNTTRETIDRRVGLLGTSVSLRGVVEEFRSRYKVGSTVLMSWVEGQGTDSPLLVTKTGTVVVNDRETDRGVVGMNERVMFVLDGEPGNRDSVEVIVNPDCEEDGTVDREEGVGRSGRVSKDDLSSLSFVVSKDDHLLTLDTEGRGFDDLRPVRDHETNDIRFRLYLEDGPVELVGPPVVDETVHLVPVLSTTTSTTHPTRDEVEGSTRLLGRPSWLRSLKELKGMETLMEGQFYDLKEEMRDYRIWVSRMGTLDGQDHEDEVVVEVQGTDGVWSPLGTFHD